MQLVEIDKKEMWVESNLVSRKIGVKHNKFIDKVNIVIEKLGNLRGTNLTPKCQFENRVYRGRGFNVCLMNREFFSLVMMRFETPKAFEWQVKFNDAFYEMEKALLKAGKNKTDIEWNQSRLRAYLGRSLKH